MVPQLPHPAVHVGLDRAHRPAEDLGDLGVGEALDVAQHHRLAPAAGQGGQQLGQQLAVLAALGHRGRLGGRGRGHGQGWPSPSSSGRAGGGRRRSRLRARLRAIWASHGRSRIAATRSAG